MPNSFAIVTIGANQTFSYSSARVTIFCRIGELKPNSDGFVETGSSSK